MKFIPLIKRAIKVVMASYMCFVLGRLTMQLVAHEHHNFCGFQTKLVIIASSGYCPYIIDIQYIRQRTF